MIYNNIPFGNHIMEKFYDDYCDNLYNSQEFLVKKQKYDNLVNCQNIEEMYKLLSYEDLCYLGW